MGKTVIMFPGQGAQETGMSQNFYEKYDVSRACFKTAEKITGLDMSKLIFEKNENLNKTEYTQIALYTAEMAAFYAVKKDGFDFDCAIGLSLGEYSAMTACGAISFEDGASLVRNRGIYMETAVPAGRGAMAAVIGLDYDVIDNVIQSAGMKNVSIANYNCPGQIVISGENESILKIMENLKSAGAKRVIKLNVSGPFHSPMLAGAGEKLKKDLKNVNICSPCIPYYANYTAETVDKNTSPEYIKELLVKQISGAVKFEQSVRKLINDGFDKFVEIGPKDTLTGFVRRIAKDMKAEGLAYEKI